MERAARVSADCADGAGSGLDLTEQFGKGQFGRGEFSNAADHDTDEGQFGRDDDFNGTKFCRGSDFSNAADHNFRQSVSADRAGTGLGFSRQDDFDEGQFGRGKFSNAANHRYRSFIQPAMPGAGVGNRGPPPPPQHEMEDDDDHSLRSDDEFGF